MTLRPPILAALASSPLQRARVMQDTGRRAHRAVGAAILAGGLALSVSVHPPQRGLGTIDPLTPEGNLFSNAPMTAGATHLAVAFAEFSFVKLGDLVTLVEFTERHPEIPTRALIGLIGEFGISNVVRSVELLSSLGPVEAPATRIPYGGGGGYWETASGEDTLHSWMSVLAFLDTAVLSHGRELFDTLRSVVTGLIRSFGLSPTPSIPASVPLAVAAAPSPPPPPPPPVALSQPALDLPPADPVAAPSSAAVAAPLAPSVTPVAVETPSPSTEVTPPPAAVDNGVIVETPVVVQTQAEPPSSVAETPKSEPTTSSGPTEGAGVSSTSGTTTPSGSGGGSAGVASSSGGGSSVGSATSPSGASSGSSSGGGSASGASSSGSASGASSSGSSGGGNSGGGSSGGGNSGGGSSGGGNSGGGSSGGD